MIENTVDLYDLNYRTYDKWYEDHKFAYLSELKALKRVVPKKGNGLEIGVGTGRFAAPLGIRYGIDPSKKMIPLAKKRGVIVVLGCGETLPFADACFDHAAVINTLCFVKNPNQTLRESHRVLKNSGTLVVGFIERNSFLGQAYQTKKSRFYKSAHFFSVEELTELIKSFGFSRFSFHQSIFQFPEKIVSIEKPKRDFGRGGFVVMAAKKDIRDSQKSDVQG